MSRSFLAQSQDPATLWLVEIREVCGHGLGDLPLYTRPMLWNDAVTEAARIIADYPCYLIDYVALEDLLARVQQ